MPCRKLKIFLVSLVLACPYYLLAQPLEFSPFGGTSISLEVDTTQLSTTYKQNSSLTACNAERRSSNQNSTTVKPNLSNTDPDELLSEAFSLLDEADEIINDQQNQLNKLNEANQCLRQEIDDLNSQLNTERATNKLLIKISVVSVSVSLLTVITVLLIN